MVKIVRNMRLVFVVELDREANAQKLLEQIKLGTKLPPALLAPLRWTQTRHPTFFTSYAQPLFRRFHL